MDFTRLDQCYGIVVTMTRFYPHCLITGYVITSAVICVFSYVCCGVDGGMDDCTHTWVSRRVSFGHMSFSNPHAC